jgi:hypothetical protein
MLYLDCANEGLMVNGKMKSKKIFLRIRNGTAIVFGMKHLCDINIQIKIRLVTTRSIRFVT